MNILGDNTFLAKMRIFSMIYGFKMADGDTGVRKRKRQNADKLLPEKDSERTPEEIDKKSTRILKRGTFWLTRIVLLRYIGFIYCESDHAGKIKMHVPILYLPWLPSIDLEAAQAIQTHALFREKYISRFNYIARALVSYFFFSYHYLVIILNT